MSKPIHTPGPVEVVMEQDRHVDGYPFKDYFIVTSDGKNRTIADSYNSDASFTEEDRHANARLLAAAYNAFDSVARRLGVNAITLAEAMQDGAFLAEVLDNAEAILYHTPHLEKETFDKLDTVLGKSKAVAS